MPESNPHRDIVDLLRLVLLAFVARTGRSALVAANLGCRWDRARPQIGVDPDIALIEPAPPGAAELSSLRTWEPGHVPPRFAVEVVSATNPTKDYEDAPVKYAVLGTRELVVFDPALIGPTCHDGPHVLQVWRHDGDSMVRVYAGAGPAHSSELDAWLVVTDEDRLRIADDAEGTHLWPTAEEAEAAARREEAAARREEAASRKRAEAALAGALRTARNAVVDLCDVLDIPLDEARRAHVVSLDAAGLEALRAHLKRARSWPF